MERPSVSNQCVAQVSSTTNLMNGFLKSLNPSHATLGEKAKVLAENLMKKSDSRVFIKQVENAPPNTYELESEYSDSYAIFEQNKQGQGSKTSKKYGKHNNTLQSKEVIVI